MPSRSFRNRLIAIFLIIAIVPLALTAFLVGAHSYSTHVADTRERQLQRAEGIATQLAAFLRRAEQELKLVIRLAGGETTLAVFQPLLERLAADRSLYRQLTLLDADGNAMLLLSNAELAPDPTHSVDSTHAEHLQSLARGEVHIHPIRFDADSGEPLMKIAMPVLAPHTGGLTAILVADLRVRAIWQMVAQQNLGSGETAYIIEDDGFLIAHRNPSLVLGGQRSPFVPGHDWQNGLAGGKVLAVGASITFGTRHFTAVVERSLTSAIAPALNAVKLIGVVTLFTLAVAMALLAVAVRSVVRPLHEITTVALEVRDGAYDRRVAIDSRDEIGQLADSFNSMTARLQNVLTELKVEVDERRQAEGKLLKANRAYQALSSATLLLDRAEDEQWILDEVCRIITNVCGFRLVWIGFIEDAPGRHVRPVAHAGLDEGYLKKLRIDLDDPVRGQGPAARCMHERVPVVVRDVDTDPSFAPWREEASSRGFAAAAGIPLVAEGGVLGVLCVYSAQPDSISDEETQLLGELASNLAQGLTSLRLRKARALAERNLRDSEAMLRRVTNAVPALVWMMHKDGGISYFNQRFYDYTGTDENQALRTGWQDCLHPDDLPEVLTRWHEAFRTQGRFEVENRLRRHDGVYRWFLVQGEPIMSIDGTTVWFGTCIDVEDRKRSELQLIQASKLATLGEMAAGMAHELGQPLNIIRITSDDAAMRVNAGAMDASQIGKAFRTVGDQAARMGQIIEHMRVFSRDDNLQQDVIDVGPLVQGVAELLGTQLAAHGIALRPSVPPQPVPVRGNAIQLEQVILNLVNNARDALESAWSGGLGTVVGRIELTVAMEGGQAVITVADDGPGIPDHVLPQIFEPFFTTKPSGVGTGLGLAISHRIVNRMAGHLEVRNRAPGAQFTITLPLTKAVVPVPSAAPAVLPAMAAGQRLLLVEDEAMATELLEDFLERRGYRVTIAGDAKEAMAAFAAQPPDLVVTDITMPEGDGVALARWMRQSRPDLPIIFVTGRIDAASLLAEQLRDGRAILLRKPVAIHELSSRIAAMLAEDDATEAEITNFADPAV